MAAAGGSAFDGAMGAMEAEAPPAWATAAAPVSPAPQGAPFGAADEEVPAWATASVPVVANDGGEEDIFNLGLEDLMNTKVVTASKSKERAFDVAAAITVITNEDLRRSGYTNVMDALRMVPGMQVAQISTPSWSVGSRGFGDEYANKLLVMIDGRSIYTSTFSGVFWDEVNLPMEDIDRIEVIRGPGATIWGANAVNGVINIVTKESKYTQGAYLSGGAGNYEKMFGEGRSGGKFGDNGHYRFYGRHLERGRWDAADGSGEQRTGIERLMSGFRADWEGGGHSSYTVQGEVQKGSTEQHTRQFGISDETEITTAYLRGRWDKVLSDDSSISLSSYLDHDSRKAPSVFIKVTNFDLDFNHKKRWLDRNELIWGLGYRLTSDNYENTSLLSFTPAEDTRHLF
ncbi:MAG: TonB-dependent receptor plug domain-containing protein, partial [Rickettsiales bacterium]